MCISHSPIPVPLGLPLGWADSPPTFCAMSETIADLANANAYKRHVPPHRLERHSAPLDQWNASNTPDSDSDSNSSQEYLDPPSVAPEDLPSQPAYQAW